MKTIQVIGIVGAGTMGNGIAHVAARSGYRVILCDNQPKALDRALETISRNMDREVTRGKLSAERKADSLSRITSAADLKALSPAQFIIEAVVENIDAKLKIFKELDGIVPSNI